MPAHPSLRICPCGPPAWWQLGGPALLLLICGLLGACREEPEHPDFVARLGDRYLTRAELADALETLPPGQDSLHAREQIVEQWVSNALLLQQARELGLQEDPEVQRLLQESEQSVLVSALLMRLYEEATDETTDTELEAYYERHKDQLRLREPFVRVLYLTTRRAEAAAEVEQALRGQPEAVADSLWPALGARHALDPQAAAELARNYYPESRLFPGQPQLQELLDRQQPGQVARLSLDDSLHHVLYLAARAPAGTVPERPWVEHELQQRLAIRTRKQMYARQVQRLRNEALAREELEIR